MITAREAREAKEFGQVLEKQTGRKHHVWGFVGNGPDMTEVAQCQVHTCLRFKVNNLKPYITLRQLLARYPNFEFV